MELVQEPELIWWKRGIIRMSFIVLISTVSVLARLNIVKEAIPLKTVKLD